MKKTILILALISFVLGITFGVLSIIFTDVVVYVRAGVLFNSVGIFMLLFYLLKNTNK